MPRRTHARVSVGWQDQRATTNVDEAPRAYVAARFIGAREMRLIVVWNRVQPTAGEWNWAVYDLAVERAQGFDVQLVLGGIGARPPAWAGARSGDTIGGGSWRHMNELAYVVHGARADHSRRRTVTACRLWHRVRMLDVRT